MFEIRWKLNLSERALAGKKNDNVYAPRMHVSFVMLSNAARRHRDNPSRGYLMKAPALELTAQLEMEP